MYKLIITDEFKRGDLLVIDKIAGKSVHASTVDTSKKVKTGPKFKPKDKRQ